MISPPVTEELSGRRYRSPYVPPPLPRTIVTVPPDILNSLPELRISSFALLVRADRPLIVTDPPDCVYFKTPAVVEGFLRIWPLTVKEPLKISISEHPPPEYSIS